MQHCYAGTVGAGPVWKPSIMFWGKGSSEGGCSLFLILKVILEAGLSQRCTNRGVYAVAVFEQKEIN